MIAKISTYLSIFILLLISSSNISSANNNPLSPSILPEGNFQSNYDCTIVMKQFEQLQDFKLTGAETSNQRFSCAAAYLDNFLAGESGPFDCDQNISDSERQFTDNDILACSIITGRIRTAYIPRFIVYSIELLTLLSGVLSLLFVILGGYFYLINSLSGSDVDKGKTYIRNAILGLSLSLSAWAIVNLFQLILMS